MQMRSSPDDFTTVTIWLIHSVGWWTFVGISFSLRISNSHLSRSLTAYETRVVGCIIGSAFSLMFSVTDPDRMRRPIVPVKIQSNVKYDEQKSHSTTKSNQES